MKVGNKNTMGATETRLMKAQTVKVRGEKRRKLFFERNIGILPRRMPFQGLRNQGNQQIRRRQILHNGHEKILLAQENPSH